MKKGAKLLIGTHNFSTFRSSSCQSKSPIKTLKKVQIKKYDNNILIAKKELEKKLLPFIIKRPLPNGECEYWKLKDLEIIDI